MLCYGNESRQYRVPVMYSNGIQFGKHNEAYPHTFDDNKLPSRRDNAIFVDWTRLSDIGWSKGWSQLSNASASAHRLTAARSGCVM